MPENKKTWYKSRMLWANTVAVAGIIITSVTGVEVDAETTVGILAVVNLILRIITKDRLAWK